VQDRLKQGKGVRSRDRKHADDLRRRKMEVRDQIWKAQDDLAKAEAQRGSMNSGPWLPGK